MCDAGRGLDPVIARNLRSRRRKTRPTVWDRMTAVRLETRIHQKIRCLNWVYGNQKSRGKDKRDEARGAESDLNVWDLRKLNVLLDEFYGGFHRECIYQLQHYFSGKKV